MMSLATIRIELIQVRTQLMKIPVFVKGAGQSVSSPSAPRNAADLERLFIKLKLLLRDLAAQENLAHVQKFNVPPHSGQRWALQQKEREAREVLDEALALRDLIDELLVKNGLLSGMDTANGLISMAKQGDSEVAQILGARHHVQVPDSPAYLPAQSVPHPVGAESVVAILAWIVLGLQRLKRKSAGI